MKRKSILAKSYIQKLLIASYQNLCWYVEIEPRIVVQTERSETTPLLLQLPDKAEEKRAFMYAFGRDVAEMMRKPIAALLTSDCWYVDASKAPQAASIPPSQHPLRQQAVLIVGRTADNFTHSMVIHPYTFDQRKIVFDAIAHEVYEEKRPIKDAPQSILDAFFEGALTCKA